MTELEDVFAELGISNYLPDFLEQGFDSWETILDITESDFDALGVKLGHRRKLQRKIANTRGISSDTALDTRTTPPVERPTEDQPKLRIESKDGSVVPGAKRKYRRHPKADENAPERPPSAYVIFSNRMREELKGRNLSFTEIAKLVGEKWQNLFPSEKEPYELQAAQAKERYNSELVEYKKTSQYKEYANYLADFKARQSNQPQGDSESNKRMKLEPAVNNVGTASVGKSPINPPAENSNFQTRIESASSMPPQTASNCAWSYGREAQNVTGKENYSLSLARAASSVPNQKSPSSNPAIMHTVYREPMLSKGHQNPVWRESKMDEKHVPAHQYPRMNSIDSHRHMPSPSDQMIHTGSVPLSHHHSNHNLRPPLMKSKQVNQISSAVQPGGTGSSFFCPRTPMEPPLDRPLQLPVPYGQKMGENFERQLPPLIPPSRSPKEISHGLLKNQQRSPSGIHRIIDINPGSVQNKREHSDRRVREIMSCRAYEENHLDPVSALLKAGEIVNRNSRDEGVDCARNSTY